MAAIVVMQVVLMVLPLIGLLEVLVLDQGVVMAVKLGVMLVLATVVVMNHQVQATAQVDSMVAGEAMVAVLVDTTHMEDRKRCSAGPF
ncbi:hypothetical protein BHE74_00024485 [Ensete ventricosum]|uniref:Uncharacterized protein n=1 Tax=Ensete ventricosum TaxID=4639 RepID=A0A444DJ07_ENSVE|nr:hypothetical protein B296_00002252 [Ensete ventricosum]RWV98083.1 hypothetical protein GW17_00039092 [Ensete ventricosum]RWW68014.1 hypothetical protein BHE74_00024485 [Ensete ventricosum]RZS26096.1 hypothetical protein BHM03_00059400 [Ensete ventricosum]